MACSLKSVTFCLTLAATIASIGLNPAVAADVEKSTVVELNDYHVIIAGGPTAAYAAANAAREGGAEAQGEGIEGREALAESGEGEEGKTAEEKEFWAGFGVELPDGGGEEDDRDGDEEHEKSGSKGGKAEGVLEEEGHKEKVGPDEKDDAGVG